MKKILLILFIIINVAIIIRSPLVTWDEATYIGIGKFVYSNAEIGLFESFRPMFLPLVLGGIWKIGMNAVTFGRVAVLLFSVGNLIMFYFIAKKYVTKNLATLGAVVLALVPIYFVFSTKIMTGVVASFFIMLSFYFFLNERYYLTAFFSGLATLTRFPAGMFFIFFLLYCIKKKSYIISMIAIFLITLSPFFLINLYFGNGLIQPLANAIIHQNNSVFLQDSLFYLRLLFYNSIFLIFSIPGIYYSVKNKIYELLLFSIIPLLYFSHIVNKQLRFVNIFLPFIVLLSLYGFYNMLKNSRENKLNAFALLLFVLISFVISAAAISKVKFPDNISPYEIFDEEGLTIITTDPIFSAYSNNKFIPVYFDVYKGYNTFIFYKDKADYFVLSDVYPCDTYLDVGKCKTQKNKLISKFLAMNYIKSIQHYYIFN